MDTVTKEAISKSQRRRWAERKAAQERVQTQLAAHEAAIHRYSRASAVAFAALERHEDDDPLARFALGELRSAFDQIALWNADARELLRDHGLPDPTSQPAAPMADGTDDDADPRRVTQDG